MDVVSELIAKGRDREGTVLEAPTRTASYSYREFATNTWKAGNILRHYGVRSGASLAVVIGPKEPTEEEPGWIAGAADGLLAVLGGLGLGAAVDITPTQTVDARALVAPAAWLDPYETAPGCSRLAYGGPPDDPQVAHFERELWSENPIEPPGTVTADDAGLVSEGTEYTQRELVDAATALNERFDLQAGQTVIVDVPLSSAGAFVAGVLAPIAVGATILQTSGDADGDDASQLRNQHDSPLLVSDRESGECVVRPSQVF